MHLQPDEASLPKRAAELFKRQQAGLSRQAKPTKPATPVIERVNSWFPRYLGKLRSQGFTRAPCGGPGCTPALAFSDQRFEADLTVQKNFTQISCRPTEGLSMLFCYFAESSRLEGTAQHHIHVLIFRLCQGLKTSR